MTKFRFLFLFLCPLQIVWMFNTAEAQSSLVERLGYPVDTKLLIIHADDLAVAHSQNQASFKALENGPVNSASIMAPCPWLEEVAAYVAAHPRHDLGVHLTLTSEWKHYKWGPVASIGEVKGLLGPNGYFYDNCADMAAHATVEEVEQELRAQIERAKAMGIEPTHLDSHMGCLFFSSPEIFETYLRLGRSYGIPTVVSRDLLALLPEPSATKVTDKDIVIDQLLTASPEDYRSGMAAYYERVFRSLEPGVTMLAIHLAYEDLEMQGVTVDHPDWGAAWRQADFDFFTSDSCQQLLQEENIQLITWREIGRRWNHRTE